MPENAFIEKIIMPKNKRPAPRKSAASPEAQEEALTQNLYQLAGELGIHQDGDALSGAMKEKQQTFQKTLKKCLQQKKDDILYEALERARYDDRSAHAFLKAAIEEASEVALFRREGSPELELNAFVIPLFAHLHGGLNHEQNFQDQEAFDLLTASLKTAQLESRDATVVLVSHAYHLDEIDGISYSQLHDMVRDAFTSMTSKKITATPAIDRSISGWPDHHFAPEDLAVELRFLLGFALKAIDDPFYQIPQHEAAADAYFAARATRFQQWTEQATPLVSRCLVTDGREVDIHFLYQDLFHGGKERGMAEYHMLEMMAELHQALREHGITPDHTRAIIGPADAGGDMVLRVNLYAADEGALLASSEKPLGTLAEIELEADDMHDALTTIGVQSLALAASFDADGEPLQVRPYPA